MKPSDGCVFIAYDLKDAGEAEDLAAALEAQGVDIWLGWRDKRTVRDATDYAEQLREAAGNCGALLLLLTGRKVDLEELGEITQSAYAADKPIYPVRTSETAAVPDFPALLRARGVVDAFGPDRDSALGRLAAELGGSSDAAEAAAEPEPEAEQPTESALQAPSWPSASETPAAPAWPAAPAAPPAPPATAWPQQPPAPAPAASWPAQPQAPAPAASGWPQAPAAPAAGGWPQTGAAPAAAAWPAAGAAPAAAPAAAWQPPGGPPVGGENEQRLREYVGPNAEYYLRKWGDMDRSRSSASWNFASFFLNAFWLAYRKMVLPAVVLVVAFLAAFILGLIAPGIGALLNMLIFGAVIFLGIMGNKLYRNQAERALADPGAAHPGALQARGGTSIGLALGLLAAYVVIAGGTVAYFESEGIGVFERSYRPSYSSSSYGTGTGAGTGMNSSAPAMSTTTATGTTVYSTWLAGKWGLSGTNCLSWVQFFGDGSLLDNAGTTGSWTLNNYTSTLNLTTPTGARTGTVSRRGETLIIDSTEGRREWQRCF